MWLGLAAVLVPPSPKVHAYESMVPSESDDPELSKSTSRKSTVGVNAAVGTTLAASTETSCDTVAMPPLLSVTVRVTV